LTKMTPGTMLEGGGTDAQGEIQSLGYRDRCCGRLLCGM
jgi:hypothetical protein